MSVLEYLSRNRRSAVPPSMTFRLTQDGREKVTQFTGDPKSRILVALESRGSSNVNEIAAASGLSRGQVERLVPQLVQAGYVQSLSRGGGGSELDD